jgi:hypothetical protein
MSSETQGREERRVYTTVGAYHRVEVEGGRVQMTLNEWEMTWYPIDEDGREEQYQLGGRGLEIASCLPLSQIDLDAGWIWEDDNGLAVSDTTLLRELNEWWDSYLRHLQEYPE